MFSDFFKIFNYSIEENETGNPNQGEYQGHHIFKFCMPIWGQLPDQVLNRPVKRNADMYYSENLNWGGIKKPFQNERVRLSFCYGSTNFEVLDLTVKCG